MLAEAVAQVELNYAKPVDRRQLIESALRGMLRDLDPYSAYLGPEQFAQFQERIEGGRPSLGIELALREGRPLVLSVAAGSPAAIAKVQPGEYVVTIDGAEVEGLSLSEIEASLQIASGASLMLGLSSPTGESRETTLQAASNTSQTVRGASRAADGKWQYLVREEPRVAQIVVSSFTKSTPAELRELLAELTKQNVEAIVFDLRFNAGGLLASSIDVADLFLKEGLIVSTAGRNTKRRQWTASDDSLDCSLPVAVLVNRYSASGAEVVAAALQDHGRATIVGERTWGKGSVQNLFELEQGASGLKLTTALYHRPSGANIHRLPGAQVAAVWGVTPQPRWALALTADEAQALLKHRSQLHTPAASDAQGAPLVDRQLDLAIEAVLATLKAASTDAAAESEPPAPESDSP